MSGLRRMARKEGREGGRGRGGGGDYYPRGACSLGGKGGG